MKLAALKPQHDSKWKLGGWITVHATALLLVVVLFPLLIARLGSNTFEDHGTGMICYADGSPHILTGYDYQRRQAWIPSLFLSITLGSGSFTFPQAKGIDIVWDLVVGRGGQLVLTVLTYPIIRRTLTYCMEKKPVSFRLFSSFTNGQVSVPSLYALATRERYAGHSRARSVLTVRPWLFAAMLLIGTYLLAFPTIVTSMTGYQSKLAAFAKDPNDPDSLLPVNNMRLPDYVVVDGPRIGLSEMYPAYSEVMSDPDGEMTLSYYYEILQYITAGLDGYSAGYANFSDPDIYNHSSNIYYEYEFDLDNGTVYLPMGNKLYGEYASNVAFEFPQNLTSVNQIKSNITLNNETSVLSSPPLNIIGNTYGYSAPELHEEQYLWVGDTMFNRTWLLDTTVCQASNDYHWGFSAGMLLLFAVATALYTILVVTLHWVVYDHSQADRYGHHVSIYRDAIDLAAELKVALGDDAQSMTGAELDEKVQQLDERSRWEVGMAVGLETQDLTLSRWDEKIMQQRQRQSERMAMKELQGHPAAQGSTYTHGDRDRGVGRGLVGRIVGRVSALRWARGTAYDKAELDEEGQVLEDLALGKHML